MNHHHIYLYFLFYIEHYRPELPQLSTHPHIMDRPSHCWALAFRTPRFAQRFPASHILYLPKSDVYPAIALIIVQNGFDVVCEEA